MAIKISDLVTRYIFLPRLLNSENQSPRLTPFIAELFENYKEIPVLTDYSMFKELSARVRIIPQNLMPEFIKIFENVIARLDPKFYIHALEEKQYDLSSFLQNKLTRVVQSVALAKRLNAHYEKGVDLREFFPYMLHAIRKVINGANDELRAFVEKVCVEALKTPGIKVEMAFSEWKTMILNAPQFSNLRIALATPEIEISFTDLQMTLLDQIAPYVYTLDSVYRLFPAVAIYQLITHPDPYSYLYNAFSQQDLEAFRALLTLGVNQNARQADGTTILHAVTSMNNIDAVRILLDHGADPNLLDVLKNAPLSLACCNNNAAIVRLLCERKAKNVYNSNNHSAFYAAVYFQSQRCLEVLVEFFGTAPLRVAEQVIVDNECHKKTLAHIATLTRNDHILKYLIQNGCSVMDPDQNGNTVLHYASNYGWLEGVQLIIQADKRVINRKNHLNQLPILFAIRINHAPIFDVLVCDSKMGPEIYHDAIRSLPFIFKKVKEHIGWSETVDEHGNTPIHHLIMNYPKEIDKNDFRFKFNLLPAKSNWLAVNHAGFTPYDLALKHIQERDILDRLLFFVDGLEDKTSPLLFKPLESRHKFANREIIPHVIRLGFKAIKAYIPKVESTVLKLLELFPEKEAWSKWMTHEIKRVHERQNISELFLSLFILAQKSEAQLYSLIFEMDESHYGQKVEPLKLPDQDAAISLEELEVLFEKLIDDQHAPICYDPDHLGNQIPIPLPLLREKITEMMRIIKNREDYMGVPQGPQKNIFYNRLDHQIRLLIQSMNDPNSDPEKVDSCIVDLARGSYYCAKRWMDESLAHVKIFYNIEDQATGTKETILEKLHQARLAIIEQISKIGYQGNWTHHESKFRHMLKTVRGIFDDVTAYDDPLGLQITLAHLLALFDKKYNSYLAITLILQMINDSALKLEKKTLIQADLRDVVTDLTQTSIRDEVQQILKKLQIMIEEGASFQQIRSFLMEKNIFWNEEQLSNLQEQGLKALSDRLRDEVIKNSFDEIHDTFFEKYRGSDLFEGYRQYNKNGVEYPQEILNDKDKAPKANETFTHYRGIASVLLLMKHQAIKARLPVPVTPVLTTPIHAPATPIPLTPSTPMTPVA